MNVVWERELTVTWDNTDKSGSMSLSGMGQLLITTATEHAMHLGFGYRNLKKMNLNWVLLKMNFEIIRFPRWDEKIKLITWPSGTNGLLGLREFLIKDINDVDLIRVSSEWMIIDLEKRRPKRLSQVEGLLKYEKSEKVLNGQVLIPNEKGRFVDLFTITIRHSALDLNGHTTAKKYFDWINDAIYEIHGENKIDKLQVKFLNESYLNEKLILQTDEYNTTFRGVKEDGKVAFVAAVNFKKS